MNDYVYEGTENYIFISYAHKDSNKVIPILEKMSEQGFRVWYDYGIEYGSEWPEYIEEHLLGCSCVLVFMSPSCINSINCRNEINLALEEKKEMLIVYLEPTELRKGMRLQLNSVQAIRAEAFSDEDELIDELYNSKILSCCIDDEYYYDEDMDEGSDGLMYELNIDEDSYSVIGYEGYERNIVIPSIYQGLPVVSLDMSEGNTDFEEIEIPDSIEIIDELAFKGCTSLKEIVIPSSVKEIGESAFYGCTELKEVEIPDSVVEIRKSAFSGCTSLKEIVIPSSVKEIRESAFYRCTNLEVYCEQEKKLFRSTPKGWDKEWDKDVKNVYWGCSREEFIKKQ